MGNPIQTSSQPNRELLCRAPREGAVPARSRIWPLAWWMGVPVVVFLMLLTLFAPETLSAQAAATPPSAPQSTHRPAALQKRATTKPAGRYSHTAHKRAVSHRRAVPHRARPATTVAAVPAAPPAPPKPNWPADQPPQAAHITWDSHGLAIEASNSSLDQILHEVATDTGAHLQGPILDERVFGTYGPGPARDVLSQLLDGAGYDVLMVGGRGDEPPQEIILTKGAPGSPQPVNAAQARNQDENEADESPAEPNAENPRPMPLRNPFGAGGPERTPQEIQQEMLMRQQQEQQRQEQQEQQQDNPQY